MKFSPISEKEASEAGLWPRGIYDFEVVSARETTSSSGNAMITIELAVFNKEGTKHRKVYDYLVDSEKMQYKIRHFASSVGMLSEYEKGELNADDLVHKTGRCQLGIDPAKDSYPAKHRIADYVPVVPGAPLISSKAPTELDDEIPF